MYLLYADESGNTTDATQSYFVLAGVPLFLDSRASRLIQLADIIAYVIFRYYEKGDGHFFNLIKHRFDTEGGIVHGLYEQV